MKRLLVFLLLLGMGNAYGQDGKLDSSFAGRGWRTAYFSYNNSYNGDEGVQKTLVQPDGKYIALLESGPSTLVRFNPNGSIDQTYGDNGLSDQAYMSVGNMAFQGNKVIVVGTDYSYDTYTYEVEVARFTSEGSLDTSFGSSGIVRTNIPSWSAQMQGIAVQQDGKIVVSGWVYSYTPSFHTSYIIIRYTADGELDIGGGSDPGFGSGGIIVRTVTDSDHELLVKINGDNKIVLAGYGNGAAYSNEALITLLRYNADGTPDTGFGVGGVATSTQMSTVDYSYDANLFDMIIQTDGKIAVTGYSSKYDNWIYTTDIVLNVMRFNIDGTPDNGFGTNGAFLVTVDSTEVYGHSLVQQGDKLIVAGLVENHTTNNAELLLLRVNANGTLDNGFASGGWIITPLQNVDNILTSVNLMNDGKVLLAGEGYNMDESGGGQYDLIFARYSSNGVPDNTFNSGATPAGTLITALKETYTNEIYASAIQPDGKIIVVGNVYNEQTYNYDFGIARFHPDGTNDNTFGTGGSTVVPLSSSWYLFEAIAVQGDGKIVAGISKEETSGYYDLALLRFTSTGELDPTFGTGGIAYTKSFGIDGYIKSLAIQGTNILVAADFQDDNFNILRYTPTGALDNSFGTGGVLSYTFSQGYAAARTLIVDPNGKIIVAGTVYNNSTGFYDIGLLRYTTRGVLDRQFGSGGVVEQNFFEYNNNPTSIRVQPDGKILIGGYISSATDDLAVFRFNANGSVDNTFGNGGIVTTTTSQAYSVGYTTADVRADGKIVAGGGGLEYTSTGNTYYLAHVDIYRFTSTGAVDNTFGTNGKLQTAFDRYIWYNSTKIFDNRFYAFGYGSNTYDWGGYLSAYNLGSGGAPPTPVLPAISIDDASVVEGATATLTVTMDKISSSPITVNYLTQDNTAVSKGKNADYRTARGSVTIVAGATTATISVATRTDLLKEVSETFFVNLSLSNQANKLATIADGAGTVTITDGPPILTLDEYTRVNQQGREDMIAGKLVVTAMPNPSASAFTLQLQSASSVPVNIRVMDITGRLIENKNGVAPNAKYRLGDNYVPGAYYAEVIQGNEKVVVKLVKQ